jgi:hypothetical protein
VSGNLSAQTLPSLGLPRTTPSQTRDRITMKPRVVLLDAGDPRVSFDSGSVLRPGIGGNVLAAASEANCSLHERPVSGAAQCIHIE